MSGTYFEVLGVKPAIGRVITREESGDVQGAQPVVVISHRLWRDRFQSDPRVVALLACYFPARRATQVNPLVALRGE